MKVWMEWLVSHPQNVHEVIRSNGEEPQETKNKDYSEWGDLHKNLLQRRYSKTKKTCIRMSKPNTICNQIKAYIEQEVQYKLRGICFCQQNNKNVPRKYLEWIQNVSAHVAFHMHGRPCLSHPFCIILYLLSQQVVTFL